MPTVFGYHDVKDRDHGGPRPSVRILRPTWRDQHPHLRRPRLHARRRADGRRGHGRRHVSDGDRRGAEAMAYDGVLPETLGRSSRPSPTLEAGAGEPFGDPRRPSTARSGPELARARGRPVATTRRSRRNTQARADSPRVCGAERADVQPGVVHRANVEPHPLEPASSRARSPRGRCSRRCGAASTDRAGAKGTSTPGTYARWRRRARDSASARHIPRRSRRTRSSLLAEAA